MTTSTLANGQLVTGGDLVVCPDRDGCDMIGIIKRRRYDMPLPSPHCGEQRDGEETVAKAGTLFFHQRQFPAD